MSACSYINKQKPFVRCAEMMLPTFILHARAPKQWSWQCFWSGAALVHIGLVVCLQNLITPVSLCAANLYYIRPGGRAKKRRAGTSPSGDTGQKLTAVLWQRAKNYTNSTACAIYGNPHFYFFRVTCLWWRRVREISCGDVIRELMCICARYWHNFETRKAFLLRAPA